jgi:hypothetical protein
MVNNCPIVFIRDWKKLLTALDGGLTILGVRGGGY